MNSRLRKQKQQIYNEDPESMDEQQKAQPERMSEMRDYMSMRACGAMIKNNKNKEKKIQKHSKVHAHLQPDEPVFDEDDDNQIDRDTDPVTLLKNYSKANYQQFIKTMKDRVEIEMPYTQQFPELIDALAMKKTNICIYGFGSKIKYIRYLVQSYLGDHHRWEVNGYKLSINDKKILNNFGKFLKDVGATKKIQKITKEDQLKQYAQILKNYDAKKQLVVMFHCIDAMNFLNQTSQQSLSDLFSLPNIKLICSLDNIKIASIWHPEVKTKYNFKFFNINTNKPNIEQQIFRPNTTDIRQQGDQAIMNIYMSLNNNQKRILKLFAKKGLQNLEKQLPDYYTIDTLLDECIQNVILSNDTQLRENLFELIDHRVIVPMEKHQQDRVRKFYTIKCNKGMLDRIYKEKVQD